MVTESQAKVQVGLKVAELEEEAGDSNGKEAAAGFHCGSTRFTLCFEFTAFLLLRLDSFSFLHPVNVGSGMIKERFKEVNGHDMNGLT